APGGSLPAGPRLRAVGGGTRAFVVSDHAGTWIDLEPVD
ncbi:endonuclease, partial [Actinomyces sp. 594]|nr:endonuclease [Actinomyces sp. 594]